MTYISSRTIRAGRISARFWWEPEPITWPTGFAGTPGAALPPRPSWSDHERFAVWRVEYAAEYVMDCETRVRRQRLERVLARAFVVTGALAFVLAFVLGFLGTNGVGAWLVGIVAVSIGYAYASFPTHKGDLADMLARARADLDEARDNNIARLERELDREINWEAAA